MDTARDNTAALTTASPDQHSRLDKALAAYNAEPTEISRQFPHLLDTIEDSWGTDRCINYINHLLLSDRPGRHGFPDAVIGELLMIKNVYEVAFPTLTFSPNDPTGSVHAAETTERLKPLSKPQEKVKNPRVGASGTSAKTWLPKVDPYQLSTIGDLERALQRLEAGQVPTGKDRHLLGDYLVEAGAIDSKGIYNALDEQCMAETPLLIGEALVSTGKVTLPQVAHALSRQFGTPIIDAASIRISSDAIQLVPVPRARSKGGMPITLHNNKLVVAVPNPFDPEIQAYFDFVSGAPATLVYATPENIAAAWVKYEKSGLGKTSTDVANGGKEASQSTVSKRPASPRTPKIEMPVANEDIDDTDDVDEIDDVEVISTLPSEINENDNSVISLVNTAIEEAIRAGASDIHFEAFPRTHNAPIRFRKDGVMEVHSEYPMSYHAAVVSRIKLMAELDISEKRKSQDGKITFKYGKRRVDLRVSTIPTSNQLETVTVRILGSGKPMSLASIGIHPDALAAFRNQITKPYGLILVCGPTGCGKTTTLHSVLRELNTPERKIWTAEDPVEIVQKNISQVQVLPKIDWTFATALRSFLRADPDIIMIGEIRDAETAKVAVEASMTGHLVMSTLHTNSAAETLARMLDLDVPAYNLADSTLAVLAQRLARRVCRHCGERYEFSDEELEPLVREYCLAGDGKAPSTTERFHLIDRWRKEFSDGGPLTGIRAVGCSVCRSGYSGRLGIYELLVVTREMRRLIRENASTGDVFRQAINGGMKTLLQDGIEKVVQGLTDIKEVRAVCL